MGVTKMGITITTIITINLGSHPSSLITSNTAVVALLWTTWVQHKSWTVISTPLPLHRLLMLRRVAVQMQVGCQAEPKLWNRAWKIF